MHQHKPGSFGSNEGFYRSAALIRLTASPEVVRKWYLLLPHPRAHLAHGMPMRHSSCQITAGDLGASLGRELLQPPVNVLRLSLHPAGLAPRIVNLAQWREHIITRLNRQVEVKADRVLADLLIELRDYPAGCKSRDTAGAREFAGVVVPLQLNSANPSFRQTLRLPPRCLKPPEGV